MGTEAPRWWRQVLDQLQVAAAVAEDAAAAGQQQPSNLQDICDILSELDDLPKLPKAIWKKVLALQVPHKLVSMCCEQPAPVAQHMAQPFALALRCLMWQAVKWAEDTAAAGPASSSLLDGFLQQLQDSGLLQHLAALMAAAAAQQIWELQAHAGRAQALTADLADFAYKHKQYWGPSSSRLQQLHLHAGQLCKAVSLLQQLVGSRCTWHALLQPLAVPALELSVLTLQHVSTCLELLPAHIKSPPQSLWRALALACGCAQDCMHWCSGSCSCCADLRQQLQQSPYHIPALCSTLLVGVYGTLLMNEADSWWETADALAAAASAGGTSSRQPGQQQEECWEQAAWSMACSRRDAVPLSHVELLQLASCSSKALLWAANDSYDSAKVLLASASAVCADFAQTVAAEFRQQPLEPHEAAAHSEEQRLQQSQRPEQLQEAGDVDLVAATTCFFLAGLAQLRWGCHCLTGDADYPAARVAGLVSMVAGALTLVVNEYQLTEAKAKVAASNLALKRIDEHRMLIEQRTAVMQQEPLPDNIQELKLLWQQQDEQQQQLQDKEDQAAKGGQRRQLPVLSVGVPVYLQLLDDALADLFEFMSLLLQLAAAQHHAAPTTGGNSSGSSAYGSNSSNSTGAAVDADTQTAVDRCFCVLPRFVEILASQAMSKLTGLQPEQGNTHALPTCMPYIGLITSSAAPALRADAQVWFRHAAQACTVLEAYVRRAARGDGTTANRALAAVTCCMGLVNSTAPALRGVLLQAAAAAAGAGSREQLQLYGLLRSMVKWAGGLGQQQQGLAEAIRVAVAAAVAHNLVRAGSGHTETAPMATAGAALGADAAGATAEQLLLLSPWLGLWGCCCLQWAQQLKQLPPDSPQAAAAAPGRGPSPSVGVWALHAVIFPQHLGPVF